MEETSKPKKPGKQTKEEIEFDKTRELDVYSNDDLLDHFIEFSFMNLEEVKALVDKIKIEVSKEEENEEGIGHSEYWCIFEKATDSFMETNKETLSNIIKSNFMNTPEEEIKNLIEKGLKQCREKLFGDLWEICEVDLSHDP